MKNYPVETKAFTGFVFPFLDFLEKEEVHTCNEKRECFKKVIAEIKDTNEIGTLKIIKHE